MNANGQVSTTLQSFLVRCSTEAPGRDSSCHRGSSAFREYVIFQVGLTDSTSCIRKMLVSRGSRCLGFVPLRFFSYLRAAGQD